MIASDVKQVIAWAIRRAHEAVGAGSENTHTSRGNEAYTGFGTQGFW